MVAFCQQCGGSLARGDLTFWMGEMFTSPDYLCPFCGKLAHPDSPKVERPKPTLPAEGADLLIRRGKAECRPATPENP